MKLNVNTHTYWDAQKHVHSHNLQTAPITYYPRQEKISSLPCLQQLWMHYGKSARHSVNIEILQMWPAWVEMLSCPELSDFCIACIRNKYRTLVKRFYARLQKCYSSFIISHYKIFMHHETFSADNSTAICQKCFPAQQAYHGKLLLWANAQVMSCYAKAAVKS